MYKSEGKESEPEAPERQGTMRPIHAELRAFVPVVQGLAEMLGPNCEVVLHDVDRIPHSIIAIENGHVTGRRVGDVPTDLMLRSLRNVQDDATPDVRLYVTSRDGKILKSLAVTLRDRGDRPIGVLGVNFDISEMVHVQRTLSALTAVGRLGSEAVPQTQEVFANDIREVVAAMVTRVLSEMGKTPGAMTRDEKREVVKRLEERGAFLVKRSAEQIAEALDLSRYTIFSYLKEIRHTATPAGATGVADGVGAHDVRRSDEHEAIAETTTETRRA